MFHLQGRVRNYNAATDTCSVEFEHLGDIEGWMDNIPIDAAVSRGFLAHHAQVTLQVADYWRLSEAILVGVSDQPSTPTQLATAGTLQTKTGRASIATDASGAGNVLVTFPTPAFTAAPTSIVATADDKVFLGLSAATATTFTANVSGGPHSSYVFFTWQATGH